MNTFPLPSTSSKGILAANESRVYYGEFHDSICFDNKTNLPAGIDCTAANTAIRAKAIKRFFISWLVDVLVNLTRIYYVNNVMITLQYCCLNEINRIKSLVQASAILGMSEFLLFPCRINGKSDLLHAAKIEKLGYNKTPVSKHCFM